MAQTEAMHHPLVCKHFNLGVCHLPSSAFLHRSYIRAYFLSFHFSSALSPSWILCVALECVTHATLRFLSLLQPFSLSSVSYLNAAVAFDHWTPACARLRPTTRVLLAGNPAYINVFSASFISVSRVP